jgi:putative transposase
MPRRLRLYAPNACFHITARTQGRQHWFDEQMRDFICTAIGIALRRTDAKLRGGVIMSNHLHLVVQQGELPLNAFMQPLLCRVALAVRRKYKLKGHVFERRFWEKLCGHSVYLATLLGYIHDNPVWAGLCGLPAEWRWSSFGIYNGTASSFGFVEPFDAVAPFPASPALVHDYEPSWRRRPMVDLRDLLKFTVRRLTNGEIELDYLVDLRGRAASQLRHELIRVAGDAGYRGTHIARSLRVSEATVSKVVSANLLRRPRISDNEKRQK